MGNITYKTAVVISIEHKLYSLPSLLAKFVLSEDPFAYSSGERNCDKWWVKTAS